MKRKAKSVAVVAFLLILLALGSCRSISLRPGEERFRIEERLGGRVRVYRYPQDLSNRLPGRNLHYLNRFRPAVGLDQLAESDFSLLRGRRFALLVNDTSRLPNLDHLVPTLIDRGIRPELVLEPEHGLYGYLDEEGPGGIRVEPKYGLRILNLHSRSHRKPSEEHLAGIELIVVDLQNLPVRCYTYISTLTYVLQQADALGIEVLVLDRPNVFGPRRAQGPLPQDPYRGFLAEAPVPFIYSMTLGEYSLYLARTKLERLRLGIIRVQEYRREDSAMALGQLWFNPSPNIPTPESALVYPGVVFFEGSNVSLGRGTTRPFVHSGAPWMNAEKVVEHLRALELPGVRFAAVSFRPVASVHSGVLCHGVQIIPVTKDFDALRTGFEYMRIVRRLHPEQFYFIKRDSEYFVDRLWGTAGYRTAIENDLAYGVFRDTWISESRNFERNVTPDRLY